MTEKLKVLDLFSGIGGFSLGLERTGGFETVAFCEIDPYAQRILNKHWPEVRQYHDITRAKFTENVDLVTAGFPCQDISYAGAGAGLTGERSGLFWYILRTLCMVGRPAVLMENVAALLGRGLSSVLGALATFGYDTEWHCIPASHVGAPHIRDRIWILANPAGLGYGQRGKAGNFFEAYGGQNGQMRAIACGASSQSENLADPDKPGLPIRNEFGNGGPSSGGKQPRSKFIGVYATGRKEQWPAEPGVGRVAHGIPRRVDRLRGLGNAVVPQIPEIIGHAILQAEAS